MKLFELHSPRIAITSALGLGARNLLSVEKLKSRSLAALVMTSVNKGSQHCANLIASRSRLRPDRGHQFLGDGDVDTVVLAAAHNRSADGIHLQLPFGGDVFLHRAAHSVRHAGDEVLDFRR